MEAPIRDDLSDADQDLARATACYLREGDGGRWEVRELAIAGDRAWITATPLSPEDGERGSCPDSPLRVFDTVLPRGTRLEWTFPDGSLLRARRSEPSGDVRFERVSRKG